MIGKLTKIGKIGKALGMIKYKSYSKIFEDYFGEEYVFRLLHPLNWIILIIEVPWNSIYCMFSDSKIQNYFDDWVWW